MILYESASRSTNGATEKSESIRAARTTLGDSPVRKAYSQSMTTVISALNTFLRCCP